MESRQTMSKRELCKKLLVSRINPTVPVTNKSLAGLSLRGLDMRNVVFMNVDFSGADLRDSILANARFYDCTFNDTDFSGAGVNAKYARFSDCVMVGADFHNADLSYVRFDWVNLSSAYFASSILIGATMRHCNFDNAAFRGAILNDAKIYATDTKKADLICPQVCPESGSFIGWKKAVEDNLDYHTVIVKLRIPETAERSSATGRKCRASAAEVLGFYDLDGKEYTPKSPVVSMNTMSFVYPIGETVTPKNGFLSNRWEECAPGIHFFMTFEEAARCIF